MPEGSVREAIAHMPSGPRRHTLQEVFAARGPSEGEKEELCSLDQRIQHIQQTSKRRVTFGRSGIHCWGLFARVPIREGEMVVDYRGEAVRRPVADIREQQYRSRGQDCYLFKVDDDWVIDATSKGNIARLINHSCWPNCHAKILDREGDRSVIVFIARRDITGGEELTYDYRFDKEEMNRVACFCGAPGCRQFMN